MGETKKEYERNDQTKFMKILHLKRELEILDMQKNDDEIEYGGRLISIVNQII